MVNNQSEVLVGEVRQSYQQLPRPFPHEDCRMLLSQDEGRLGALVPDLDLYFSTIAGYGSWGGRILNWDAEQINLAGQDLRKSFFQSHTEYRVLEDQITETETPSLYVALTTHEHLRDLLLELMTALSAQRTERFSLQEAA